MTFTGKVWKVKVIEGDKRGSSAFYPASVLEAQSGIVAPGTRIYLDHPSLDEAENRPERSARDIIGYFKSGSTYEGKDLYAEAEFFSEWREWVKERAEAGVIGMSIRGSGNIKESEDGTPVLESFEKIASVDLVTTPGAGGGFEEILEAQREESTAGVAEPKEEIMEFPKELAEALDTQAKDVKALTESVTALIEALAPKEPQQVEESEAPKASDITEALIESGLTKTARARVLAAVEGGAELAEAIKAEKDLAEEILKEAADAKKGEGKEFQGNLEESKGEKPNFGTLVFG